MRFRFTIRDLLWLTVVVALAVGWWLDHSHWPDIEFWRRVSRERHSYANVDLSMETPPATH